MHKIDYSKYDSYETFNLPKSLTKKFAYIITVFGVTFIHGVIESLSHGNSKNGVKLKSKTSAKIFNETLEKIENILGEKSGFFDQREYLGVQDWCNKIADKCSTVCNNIISKDGNLEMMNIIEKCRMLIHRKSSAGEHHLGSTVRRWNKINEEQLISLVQNNPDSDQKYLSGILGVSKSAVSNKIRELEKGGEISYIRKRGKVGGNKVDKNKLISLVQNNPDSDQKYLSGILGVSKSAVSNKIRELEKGGEISYSRKTNEKYPDEKLIEFINSNPLLKHTDLAEKLGVKPVSISKRIKKLELEGKILYNRKPFRKKGLIDNNDLLQVIIDNPNFSKTDIAKYFGVNPNVISKRIRRNDFLRERYNPKIDYKPKKFTDTKLHETINSNPELPLSKIANLLGVTKSAVYYRVRSSEKKGILKKEEITEQKSQIDELIVQLKELVGISSYYRNPSNIANIFGISIEDAKKILSNVKV